jgi:hypothetical protein
MEEERQYRPVQQYNPGPLYDPGRNRFTFFAGVIIPALSITVEAATHICADRFFDPIPTVWHLLLVIFVPLAQLQVWFAIRRRAADRLALAGFLNAITIGISIFYAIAYLPLVPLALFALLFGVGLLPLAPFLSLLASLIMRHQLRRISATAPQRSFTLRAQGLLAGLALTAAVIGMVELPATLTTFGLYMATAATPQTQADGIRFLRKYGDKEALLRAGYDRTGWTNGLIGASFKIENPITLEELQEVYYRLTGDTFDGSIPPQYAGKRLVQRDTISLVSSKLDGTVDADGAWVTWSGRSSFETTLTCNKRRARCNINSSRR